MSIKIFFILLVIMIFKVKSRHMDINVALSKLEKDKVEFIGKLGVDGQYNVEGKVQIEI